MTDKLIEAVEEIKQEERRKWQNLAVFLARLYQINFDRFHNTDNLGRRKPDWLFKAYFTFHSIYEQKTRNIIKTFAEQDVDEKLLQETLAELAKMQQGSGGDE